MRALINLIGLLIWFPLQAIVITRLVRGEWRRYPVLFIFSVVDLLITAAEVPTVWAVYRKVPEALLWRAVIYERREVIIESLTFMVVLSLISRASEHLQSRQLIRAACIGGAIVFAGTSLAIHYDSHLLTGEWMAPWSRDLNVCTTILDLALWMLLMARRRQDRQLLLLSGGLGTQFTGEAIGHSLRSMASRQHPWPSLAGGILVVMAGLVRLYIWGRAFRTAPQPQRPQLAPVRMER